jgi:hypothetical protein
VLHNHVPPLKYCALTLINSTISITGKGNFPEVGKFQLNIVRILGSRKLKKFVYSQDTQRITTSGAAMQFLSSEYTVTAF